MYMNVFILAVEPLDMRYTAQWYIEIPKLMQSFFKKNNIEDINIHTICGDTTNISNEPTKGGFLNFIDTNIWKNSQINNLIQLFSNNVVKQNDIIFFPDAWHTGVLQIKYVSDLMNIPVKIHSIWHAGSYDKTDVLGIKIKDKNWSYNTEKALYHASDYNYFASNYHLDLFLRVLNLEKNKAYVVGFPFEFLKESIYRFENVEKEDIVLFPHRITQEKQPEIFDDLKNEFTKYTFIRCQDENLSKEEYYKLLLKSKFIFSASLHENLGISVYEGLIAKSIPILPNRVSYKEIYLNSDFLYPSIWTENFDSYLVHKHDLINFINKMMKNYDKLIDKYYDNKVFKNELKRCDSYFNSDKLFETMFK